MKKIALYFTLIAGVTTILLSFQEKRDDGFVKITKKRIPMDDRLLSLCIGPEAVVGPHAVAEVNIYVNQAVLDYRKGNPDLFNYPVGSVFLKEKYPTVNSKTPDISTKMVKMRNAGNIADWDFSMYSLPDLKRIEPRGRISCASCHERYVERGFISKQSEAALRDFFTK